ncbi:MAG: hypothetical protein ACLRM8_09600 [Alistipes sp.]
MYRGAILRTNAISAQNYERTSWASGRTEPVELLDFGPEGASISTDSRASFHVAVTDQILLCNKLPFYLETGLAFSSRGGRSTA